MEAFRKILGRDTAPDDEILKEKLRMVSERRPSRRGPVEPFARRAREVKLDSESLLYMAQRVNSSPNVHLVRRRKVEAPPERTRSPVDISNPRREAPPARPQLDESSPQRLLSDSYAAPLDITLSDSNAAPPERVLSDSYAAPLDITLLDSYAAPPERVLSGSYEAPSERIQSGPKMPKPRHEEFLVEVQSFVEMGKEQNEVISEEVRPQSKPAQEELPDLIEKVKVKEKEIEKLGQSLEILYNRRILEKEEFQRMVVNLERDNVQMLDAMAELHQLRERTDFENVDLQRLSVNLRRESNEVANTMAKLQKDNKRLSLENDKLRHSADNFRRDNVDVRIAMARLREECDRLELENGNIRKEADRWRYELDNESSRNALKEQKNREEMEEKYIKQRIEHEELKSTIKEKEEEILRKDSIYQELLQKNKAQKKVRMS